MEYNPEDIDVIHLLKKLKQANGTYPPEMLALRRQRYLGQVAEITGVAGFAATLKNSAKSGKSVGLPPAAGTVVEALLVVALVAEAGAVTYFYRDKLAEVFRSITNSPKVEEVSSPPVLPSAQPEITFTSSPVVTETMSLTPSPVVTVTETLAPVDTPSVERAADPDPTQEGETDNPDIEAAATEPAKGNNGNHYGQTPKPVRTKDSGNTTNNNQDNKNNDPTKKP